MYFNNLNPGPTQPPPYQQPGAANPAPQAGVADYPVGTNNLTYPLPLLVNPGGDGSTGAPFPAGITFPLVGHW